MTNNFTPAKAGQQSKRLSKEEYAEKMKAEKEAVYQMADDTAKAIVSDPEKFKAFLDTQSRLDRYSAVNALLIFKQLPEASQLKNFDDWSKDNVKIQKGAKSISILEPVEYAKRDGTTGISYNVKKVFDVSQTNGKRPPAPTVNRDPKALITVMLDSSPVEVEATNELPYPNMAAFYNNEEQTLYVKRDVGDSVSCRTLSPLKTIFSLWFGFSSDIIAWIASVVSLPSSKNFRIRIVWSWDGVASFRSISSTTSR